MMIEKIELKNERRMYVEGHLFSCLKVFPQFDAIKYAKNIDTREEFLRITDVLGGKCFLDITGETEADIFIAVATIVLMSTLGIKTPPKELIIDLDKKKAVAPLFRVRNEVSYE